VLADENREHAARAALRSTPLAERLGRVLVGYRREVKLAASWQLLCGVIFLASGAAVFAVTGSLLKAGEEPRGRQTIRLLGRLDDYTRLVGPRVRNTIPGFLAMSGRVGIVDGSSPPRILTDITDSGLEDGFCSTNVATVIRQQYPGSYDRWKDADLVRTVLVKHPEYKDRQCILPAWIDAVPHDIVKYDPAPPTSGSTLPYRSLMLTTLITAAFATLLLNVYYRIIA
jgi:hypothetical protein